MLVYKVVVFIVSHKTLMSLFINHYKQIITIFY